MKGKVYPIKDTNKWKVYFPWKGKPLWFYTDVDGLPFYAKEYAERVLNAMRVQVDKGIFDPANWGKQTALIFQKAWQIYQKLSPPGASRDRTRESTYQNYLLPYFKDRSLKEIEEEHINEWFSKLPKMLAPSTLRLIQNVLKGFLNYNRVTWVKRLRYPKVIVNQKTPEYLTRDQQEKVFPFIPVRPRRIIKFLQVYGCRVSEGANLKRTAIDWEKDQITFRERKNDKENTLPIFDEIREFLKLVNISNPELVFCTTKGKPYTRSVLGRIWNNACKKAGIKSIPLKNATRHSRACQLLADGWTSMKVARFLGNSPRTVERFYGTIPVEQVREMVKKSFQNKT